MPEKSDRVILGLGALGWLVIAASLFYISHKPFSPEQALTIARAAGQAGSAALVVLLAGGIGTRMLPALELLPPVRLVLRAALGLGWLGLLVLLIGSVRINPLICWLTLLAIGIVIWRYSLVWVRDWQAISGLWRAHDGMVMILTSGLATTVFFTLCTALAPPLKFDALVYHLALPARYLQAGRVAYAPDITFWGMPQTGEMLYTLVMGLGFGTPAGTALGWGIGLLTLVGVIGYVQETFDTRAAWVAGASLLEGFTLAASLAWGYVDWLTALFGLAFFVALDSWRQKRGNYYLVLAGIFAGFALGTKYTGGILLLTGMVGVIGYHLFDRGSPGQACSVGRRTLLYSLARFLVPGILVTVPWWLRNMLFTGNPFYPFFFPSGALDQFRLDFYQIPVWGSWLDSVLLPWRAVFLGSEGAPGYSATMGYLLVSLGLCAPLAWKSATSNQRRVLTTSGLIALTGWVVWGGAGRLAGYLIQTRLYQSLFPALAVLAGAGFAGLDQLRLPGVRLGRVAGTLIALSFVFSTVQMASYTLKQGAPQYLLSLRSDEDYLADNLGWYAPAMTAVRELPESSQVLMLWEARSLYCAPRCQPDDILDRWKREVNQGGDADVMIGRWREQGYTHLLYYRLGADFVRADDQRYSKADWQALDSLLSRLPAGESFGDAYVMYSLRP
jgi:hypothetical protein